MFSAPGLISQEGLPSLDGNIKMHQQRDNKAIKSQIQSYSIVLPCY
jgi:hypothetical protein